jgi:y4mF family transcriptional regulator
MNQIELSQLIKAKRKASGLTQEELANKAGVGLRFIRELERGKPTLQMNKVNQVLFMFGYQLGPVPLNRHKLINENR